MGRNEGAVEKGKCEEMEGWMRSCENREITQRNGGKKWRGGREQWREDIIIVAA